MVQLNPQMMSAETHAHVAFFRRRWVQTLLPMGTSLALHLGLAIFGYSIYRVATEMRTHAIAQERPVDNIDYATAPGTLQIDHNFLGKGDKPKDALGNADFAEVESPTFNPKEAKSLVERIGGESEAAVDASMIGFGPRRGTSGNLSSEIGPIGPGKGNLHIGRSDGVIDGGGKGPLPKKINSSRVVFVCDATGSMTAIFGGLRAVLRDTINGLELTQAFNVVFFSDDKVMAMNPGGLMLATDENKGKAVDFMSDISPRGQTNPLPAIRSAFAQKPELIYVLTDGFDQVDSLESVYAEFAALNKDGKVRVNTILIGSREQKELVDILQRIAKDNRGTMRIVSKDDF